MAFKAVIHGLINPAHMLEIQKIIAQYRAEKTAKYLSAMGVTCDTIRECLQQEKNP